MCRYGVIATAVMALKKGRKEESKKARKQEREKGSPPYACVDHKHGAP